MGEPGAAAPSAPALIRPCLQLVIKDALKLDGLGRFLKKIRNIAGRLRAPRTDAVLKDHNKSMIIDLATRWGSTFAMLKRLLE